MSASGPLFLYLLNQLREKEGGKEGVLSSSRQKKSLFVSVDWTPLAPIEGRRNWSEARGKRQFPSAERKKGSACLPGFLDESLIAFRRTDHWGARAGQHKKRPMNLMRKSSVTKASVSSSDERKGGSGKKAEDGWMDGLVSSKIVYSAAADADRAEIDFFPKDVVFISAEEACSKKMGHVISEAGDRKGRILLSDFVCRIICVLAGIELGHIRIDTDGRWQTLISVFSAPPRHSPKNAAAAAAPPFSRVCTTPVFRNMTLHRPYFSLTLTTS